MSNIHINYERLSVQEKPKTAVPEDLVKKAKGMLGFSARKELLQLFDNQLRQMAVEVAQRQANPQLLYEAGSAGLQDALKMYEPGETTQRFPDFALPFIRAGMINARDKAPA